MKQKNKVRPIDDYKTSLVNFAITQNEGVTIHSIHHIASMLAFWMSGSLRSEDGLVVKCWDFSDAYKQAPLSDEAFHLDSYLAVYVLGYPPNKENRASAQKSTCFDSLLLDRLEEKR